MRVLVSAGVRAERHNKHVRSYLPSPPKLSYAIYRATVVLTCRFILDLHDASNGVGRSHSSATSGYGVPSIGHPRGAAYLSTVQLDFSSAVASEVYEAVIGWDRVAWSDDEDHSDELYELQGF